MGSTVFAAPSPDSEVALEQQAQELNRKVTSVGGVVNGRSVSVTANKPTTTQVSAAKKEASSRDSSAELIAMSNLTVPAGTDTSKGITITLYVSNVHAGDNVYVLHQRSDGSWETLKPASVSNGRVTVTLYSLSPIVVVKYNEGVNLSVSNPPAGNTTNNTAGDTQTNNNNNNQSNNNTQNNNNNQSNNNNQNNTQTNNNTQNNPVNVNQNVTVNYPGKDEDNGDYDDGYADGYKDGRSDTSGKTVSSGSSTNKGSSRSSVSKKTNVKSPKTGENLPAAPLAGLFALAGIGLVLRKLK